LLATDYWLLSPALQLTFISLTGKLSVFPLSVWPVLMRPARRQATSND